MKHTLKSVLITLVLTLPTVLGSGAIDNVDDTILSGGNFDAVLNTSSDHFQQLCGGL